MSKKIVILIGLLLVMLIVGFIWANQRRLERVEKPLEQDSDQIEGPIQVSERDALIKGYLTDFYGQTNFGGRVYCDHEFWGSDQQPDRIYYYLWALCQEYYLDEAGNLQKGLVYSGPVVLTAVMDRGRLTIVEHRSFEDDRDAAKAAFPEIYHHRLEASADRQERLERSVQRAAEKELLPGMGK